MNPRKGCVECHHLPRVHVSWGYCSVLTGCNGTRKRDLGSFQEMVCWWGLRLKLIRTRVGRPLLFCKQFPVKYPLFSPFSASQFVWRNPIFSFKFKIWNPIFLITLPSGKFDQLNVLWFSSIKKPRGSVSWVSCLIRTPVFAFSGFRCVLYLLSFCWCFTFESQFYAFAWCDVL